VPVNAMCVTPFDAHDRLDEAALMVIVDWLAAAGVGIYLGSYGTGEGHLLRPARNCPALTKSGSRRPPAGFPSMAPRSASRARLK